MVREHSVDSKIKISKFMRKIKAYRYENIEATAHTFFRLSEKQRKIYTEKELKDIIFDSKPSEVAIQNNKNYAVIYIHQNGKYLKILLDLTPNKVYIVTFYFLNKKQEKDFKK